MRQLEIVIARGGRTRAAFQSVRRHFGSLSCSPEAGAALDDALRVAAAWVVGDGESPKDALRDAAERVIADALGPDPGTADAPAVLEHFADAGDTSAAGDADAGDGHAEVVFRTPGGVRVRLALRRDGGGGVGPRRLRPGQRRPGLRHPPGAGR